MTEDSLTLKAQEYSHILLKYKDKNPLLSNVKIAQLIKQDEAMPYGITMIRKMIPLAKRHVPEEFTLDTNGYDLPESDYIDRPPYVLPKECNNILYLTDIHIPYHAMIPIRLAIKYGIEKKVNTIILGGDVIDCYQMSRFVKNPKMRTMGGEINLTKQFLRFLRSQFPDAKIIYKQGNHELRWYNYIYTNAPALADVDKLDFKNIFDLDEMRIDLVDAFTVIQVNQLNIIHGHEIIGNGVNNARNKRLKAMDNVLSGHHHKTQEDISRTIADKVIGSWTVGCLSGLKPDYMCINDWNWGFAHIETSDKTFTVHNKKIILGTIL